MVTDWDGRYFTGVGHDFLMRDYLLLHGYEGHSAGMLACISRTTHRHSLRTLDFDWALGQASIST